METPGTAFCTDIPAGIKLRKDCQTEPATHASTCIQHAQIIHPRLVSLLEKKVQKFPAPGDTE